MSCDGVLCEWLWSGFSWVPVSNNCPESCSCSSPPPLAAGTVSNDIVSTPCEFFEEEDCENLRLFSSIRTNKCCCPCFAYRDEFTRTNCSVCPDQKILGVKVKISGAQGKYEEDYCEWVWNSETEEWENISPCPEHFGCPEPDQSPPKSEGEIRKTLCDLIRGMGEEEKDYQLRRQAVRKNMCCDKLNGEYFIPIDRDANRRRVNFREKLRPVSIPYGHCGSKIFRLDGLNFEHNQGGDPFQKLQEYPNMIGQSPGGGKSFLSRQPGDTPTSSFNPLSTVFDSLVKIKNSDDPEDKNECDLQIEWEIFRIVKLGPSQGELSGRDCDIWPWSTSWTTSIGGGAFEIGSSSLLLPSEWENNDKFLKLYISMSGNNKPNKFNYDNLIEHADEVAEKFPEKQPNEEYMDWNPDSEGLLPRGLYVFGKIPNTNFLGGFEYENFNLTAWTPYPITHILDGFRIKSYLGDETNLRGPWQIFNCDNCGGYFNGDSYFGYKFSRFSGCCSPTTQTHLPIFQANNRFIMGDGSPCSNPNFKIDTNIDKNIFNQTPIPISLFMTFKRPWTAPISEGGSYEDYNQEGQLSNSINWKRYFDWPYPTPFGVSQQKFVESTEGSSPFFIGQNLDYQFNSNNSFLGNFICGENIRVEAEIIYEEMHQNEDFINDLDPYAFLKTPNTQAYGPNWKVCSGEWFISREQQPLTDSSGNLIFRKTENGEIDYLIKGGGLGNCPVPQICSNFKIPPSQLPGDCFVKDAFGNKVKKIILGGGLVTTSNNARIVLLKRQGYPSGHFGCLVTPLQGTKHRIYIYSGNNDNICDYGDPWIIELEAALAYDENLDPRLRGSHILRIWRGTYIESEDNTFPVGGAIAPVPITVCISEEGVMVVQCLLTRKIICSTSFGSGKYFAIGSGSNNQNPVIFNYVEHIEHFDSNPDCPECFKQETCFPQFDGNNIFGYNITLEPTSAKGGIWGAGCSSVCDGFTIFVPVGGNPEFAGDEAIAGAIDVPCFSKKYGGLKQVNWFPDSCRVDLCPPFEAEPYGEGPAIVSWTINCSNCENGNGEIILNISISQTTACDTQNFSVTKSFPCNTDPNNIALYNEPAGGFSLGNDSWPCQLFGGVGISATPLVRQGCCNIEEDD
jgi:hypothetical protein